jgi:amino acid adenylation domain-containing protein
VLPASLGQPIVLDEVWQQIAGYALEDLAGGLLGLAAEDLVYVIYTSGSTGRPKGTAMSNRSMVNLIEWHRRSLPAAGTRVLQFAALSFDVAFQETFSTLCTGGTLVMLEEWVRRDAPALLELLGRRSIARLFVPPLMLQSLAECFKAQDVAALGSLRDVITAGEQLRITAEIRELFERLSCRLHNHYGPTETHVVTALTLPPPSASWPALPTIGKPIANTQIHVLDGQRQPTPVGVVGEIYIGGASVARGYRGRAELTAQRFVPDPFGGHAAARMYRSGDLGRWRADGTLEYLGRNDEQVKIRGYRIELGEIEAQLAQHAQVKRVAVVAREEVAGDKRLVAYVTPADSGVTGEALRAHLRAVLPEHMVPSAFVLLEQLPLTPSGKLDRRALPAPQLDASVSPQYEPPLGQLEQLLADIWQDVLRLERVGRHDNFFELGGHSLTATRLTSRIREKLQVELPLREIFDAPTVAQLSLRLVKETSRRAANEASLIADRARDLRLEIDGMQDDAVMARIEQLERQLTAECGRPQVERDSHARYE